MRGFQIGGGGARRGLTLPVEVNRLLPRRNPSGGEYLYSRCGGGLDDGAMGWAEVGVNQKWTLLFCFSAFLLQACWAPMWAF